MPETDRPLPGHRPGLVAGHRGLLIVTGVTNARTEAANTTIKQLKAQRPPGYRNPRHYRARILLASAARKSSVNTRISAASRWNCEEPQK